MDSREFSLWQEMFYKEPYGQEWERSALIAGAILKAKEWWKLMPHVPPTLEERRETVPAKLMGLVKSMFDLSGKG